MDDLTTALPIIALGLLIVLFVAVNYGFGLEKTAIVVEMRRFIAWRVMAMPWPYGRVLPGVLPGLIGTLLAMIGGAIARTDVSGPAFDLGRDLAVIGIGFIALGVAFMFAPPRRLLPGWYRDALERRSQGLDPELAPPRGGAHPTLSRRELRLVLLFTLGIILATPLLHLRVKSVLMGLAAGLAILSTYKISGR